jgi:hypothetical protein
MGMRFILWAVLIAALAYIWGREILALGEARREGIVTVTDLQRFRRRTLGVVLLLLLGIGMDLSFRLTWEAPWQEVGFYGIFLILFFWLLIVAARDLRASLLALAQEQQGVTLMTLEELRRTMQGNTVRRDTDRIPLMDFAGRPRDGSSARIPKMKLSSEAFPEEESPEPPR